MPNSSPPLPDQRLAELAGALPVSAAAFIVTLYGDVVAPRGGELWTGNIVETLALVGLSESRARTALSRLVAADQLSGSREGRRSFYRLTPRAAATFSRAARLIHTPAEPPPLRGWHLVLLPTGGQETHGAALARARFGFATPELAVLPDRGQPLEPLPGARFHATTTDDLAAALADAWPLADIAARARRFITLFEPLEGGAARGREALGLRLLLVHAFRDTALRDPVLPPELLPPDWPVPAARALFLRLYRTLSTASDREVSRRFLNAAGPLRAG